MNHVSLRFVLTVLTLSAVSLSPHGSLAQGGKLPVQPSVVAGATVVGESGMVVERPLPRFTLYQSDDQVVPAQMLTQSGYWLVIYREAKCDQCDALMQMLALHATGGKDASRLVIVVPDVSGSELLALELEYPQLAGAHWLRDLKHNFSASVGIAGTPHILGLRNGGLRWQHGGFSSMDATLPVAIDSWLGYNRLPANKLTVPVHKPVPQKASANAPTGDSH